MNTERFEKFKCVNNTAGLLIDDDDDDDEKETTLKIVKNHFNIHPSSRDKTIIYKFFVPLFTVPVVEFLYKKNAYCIDYQAFTKGYKEKEKGQQHSINVEIPTAATSIYFYFLLLLLVFESSVCIDMHDVTSCASLEVVFSLDTIRIELKIKQ
uniref:Uncharacterized protein n=1 Tax=Glossina brevipalpis TaxID=37001 RepID=A0A1A9X4S9_9MUSC